MNKAVKGHKLTEETAQASLPASQPSSRPGTVKMSRRGSQSSNTDGHGRRPSSSSDHAASTSTDAADARASPRPDLANLMLGRSLDELHDGAEARVRAAVEGSQADGTHGYSARTADSQGIVRDGDQIGDSGSTSEAGFVHPVSLRHHTSHSSHSSGG